ncbi:MAG TPA: glycosyltransferase, partial [Pyrodictium sp.]|nr:glycosyltransferase [Pyrodictium sp.]
PYVVKEYRHVRFVFIGPGDAEPYKALAKRLGVENYVIFLGFVDEETKLAALDASTCLVLPSICDYVEVYPMVISEAWARRRAVIASSVGGIPYRVKHMVNGLLVPPKDHRKLAKAILTLLQDKSLAKKLGERGFRKVLTWDLVASILLKLYSKTSTG